MKIQSRCLAAVLAAVLVLNGPAAKAAEPLLGLSGPAAAVSVGETVRLSVNALSPNVAADGKLTISFDAGKLAYQSTAAGAVWGGSQNVVFAVNAPVSGQVVIAFAAAEAKGAGALFDLTFKVIGEGSAEFSVLERESYITGAEGRSLSAKASVDLKGAGGGTTSPTLKDLTVTGVTAAQIPASGSTRVPLQAIAVYSDGKTSTVTSKAKWSILSSPGGVSVNRGQVTVRSGAQAGDVVIQATFEGIVKTHTITLRKDSGGGTGDGGGTGGGGGGGGGGGTGGGGGGTSPTDPTDPTLPTEPARPTAVTCTGYGDPNCPTQGFGDLFYTGEFHTAIDFMVVNGYMNGVDPSTFAPASPMNRGMLVTILHRLAGTPTPTGAMPFTDVAKGSYCYEAVQWAFEQGITTGMTAQTFRPDGLLDRSQIVTMLYRYAQSAGMDTSE